MQNKHFSLSLSEVCQHAIVSGSIFGVVVLIHCEQNYQAQRLKELFDQSDSTIAPQAMLTDMLQTVKKTVSGMTICLCH